MERNKIFQRLEDDLLHPNSQNISRLQWKAKRVCKSSHLDPWRCGDLHTLPC